MNTTQTDDADAYERLLTPWQVTIVRMQRRFHGTGVDRLRGATEIVERASRASSEVLDTDDSIHFAMRVRGLLADGVEITGAFFLRNERGASNPYMLPHFLHKLTATS